VVTNGSIFGSVFDLLHHTDHCRPSQAPIYNTLESNLTEAIRKEWNLPPQFSKAHDGAGLMATTIGYCSITATWLLKLQKLKSSGFDISKTTNHPESKFVLYYYDVAHSHVQKAAILNDIKHLRELPSIYDPKTKEFKFDYQMLDDQMQKDASDGLIPFVAFGVIGATANGMADDLPALTKICKKHDAYCIVDAAWSGTFTCNEEFKFYLEGLEKVDFYLMNFSKCGGSGMESSIIFMQEKTKYME
jgi:glutamate/tyrosine decarboxylase-like PLP-dependent enzyme